MEMLNFLLDSKTLLVIGLLIIVGITVYFFYRRTSTELEKIENQQRSLNNQYRHGVLLPDMPENASYFSDETEEEGEEDSENQARIMSDTETESEHETSSRRHRRRQPRPRPTSNRNQSRHRSVPDLTEQEAALMQQMAEHQKHHSQPSYEQPPAPYYASTTESLDMNTNYSAYGNTPNLRTGQQSNSMSANTASFPVQTHNHDQVAEESEEEQYYYQQLDDIQNMKMQAPDYYLIDQQQPVAYDDQDEEIVFNDIEEYPSDDEQPMINMVEPDPVMEKIQQDIEAMDQHSDEFAQQLKAYQMKHQDKVKPALVKTPKQDELKQAVNTMPKVKAQANTTIKPKNSESKPASVTVKPKNSESKPASVTVKPEISDTKSKPASVTVKPEISDTESKPASVTVKPKINAVKPEPTPAAVKPKISVQSKPKPVLTPKDNLPKLTIKPATQRNDKPAPLKINKPTIKVVKPKIPVISIKPTISAN